MCAILLRYQASPHKGLSNPFQLTKRAVPSICEQLAPQNFDDRSDAHVIGALRNLCDRKTVFRAQNDIEPVPSYSIYMRVYWPKLVKLS